MILNLHSGREKAGKLRPKIEEALHRKNLDFTLLETQGPGHAEKLAQKEMVRLMRLPTAL